MVQRTLAQNHRRHIARNNSVLIAQTSFLTADYVSPLFGEYEDLPPFLIQTGEREVLHDDGKRVVEKARQAGVDAHFLTLPGLIHCTENWCHVVPEGRTALNEASTFLKLYP